MCYICDDERAREAAEAKAATMVAAEVPTSRVLTREMLLKGNPCYDYRTRFIQRFTDGKVEVTLELALAQKEDWDWHWAGVALLSRKAKAEFSKRSREAEYAYDTVMQPYFDLSNAAYDKYYAARREAQGEARMRGLGYTAAYIYVAEATDDILSVSGRAVEAAATVAAEIREVARIRAFVELFLADGEAYEEEHKNDAPFVDNYDENGYELDSYDSGYDEEPW